MAIFYYDLRIETITTTAKHSNNCLFVVKYDQVVDVEDETGFRHFSRLEAGQFLLCRSEHLLQRVSSHFVPKKTGTAT